MSVAARRGARAATTAAAGLARRRAARPGVVLALGEGANGALGTGTTGPARERPIRAEAGQLRGADVVDARAGWGHSAFLDAEGRVIVCGRTHDVQQAIRFGRMAANKSIWLPLLETIGSNSSIDFLEPGVVPLEDGAETCKAVAVEASAALTAALTDTGKVFMLGSNLYGQCGRATRDMWVYDPGPVKGFPKDDAHVVQMALGFRHCVALTKSGTVFTWGKGQRGQLGQDLRMQDVLEAEQVDKLPGRTRQVAAGFNHTLALQENGEVYVWGKFQKIDRDPDTGVVSFDDAFLPTKVDFGGRKVERVWAGPHHNVAVTADNRVWQWGRVSDRAPVHAASVERQLRQQKEALRAFRLSQPFFSAKKQKANQQEVPTVYEPVEVALPGGLEWHSDAVELALGFDTTYLVAEGLEKPLAWDWNLTPVPLDLHDSRFAEALETFEVSSISAGWQHTLLVGRTRGEGAAQGEAGARAEEE